MIAGLRKYAYMTSLLAIACFFLFPEPNIAVIGALLLQTLAYIIIAGKSMADGFVLTGISFILAGALPADHPLMRGSYYHDIKLWIIVAGIGVIVLGLLLLVRQMLPRH